VVPELTVNAKKIRFKPGSKLASDNKGIHATFDKTLLQDSMDFTFDIQLRGMEKFELAPVAKSAHVDIKANWPHPSFIGKFLPTQRTISDEGYSAKWQITSFASNVEDYVQQCANKECSPLKNSGFGINHIDPINVYQQSDRAIKYGFLFIALIFCCFFLFEVMKSMSIHGIQYTFVGLAIASFYLLLLALSEHIAFTWAYLIAGISCVMLMHAYIKSILKGHKPAILFSSILTALLVLLFLIIRSEDFALLMGSILSFGALGALMIGTRNVDWYEVGNQLGNKRT
jgi:inner membrane protein